MPVVLYLNTGAKHEELLPNTIPPTSSGMVRDSSGCSDVALAANSNTAACTTSGLSVAGSPHNITATYSGTTSGTPQFDTSTSSAVAQTVSKASLTVEADDKSRAFGAANPTFISTITGFKNNDPGSVVSGTPALSTTATQQSPVGTYPITPSIGTLAAANYSFNFVNGTLTVGKADQTITFGALADKTYGASDFPVSATASSGLQVSFESDTTGVCTVAENTIHIVSTGVCTITASQSGNGNYNAATAVKQSFSIGKANQATLTVTSPDGGSYGDVLPIATSGGTTNGALSFQASGTASEIVTSGADAGKLKITSGTGTCSVTATKAADGNYQSATSAPQPVAINKAVLNVNADNNSKTYGEANPTNLGWTYGGFVKGDASNNVTISGQANCTIDASAGPGVGTYADAITCAPGNLSSGNYSFATGQKGTLTITARPITVSAVAKSKVYGADDPTLTYTLTNGSLANGDTLSGVLTGSLTRDAGESIGSYTITRGTLAGNNNYTLRFNTGTLKIVYKFSLFLQPINDTAHDLSNNPDVSTFKAGSTVPVKFQLKDANGNVVQSATAPQWLTPQKGSATTQAVDETVFADPVTSGSTYKYDATAQQYIYNWGTKGMAAGYYYKIGVKLDDGQTYYTYISLR